MGDSLRGEITAVRFGEGEYSSEFAEPLVCLLNPVSLATLISSSNYFFLSITCCSSSWIKLLTAVGILQLSCCYCSCGSQSAEFLLLERVSCKC